MTSANVFGWMTAGPYPALNANASAPKTGTDSPDMMPLFASMMNLGRQTVPAAENVPRSGERVSGTAPADAFDQYQYKETKIAPADASEPSELAEKIEANAEELADFKETVVKTIAGELEVSEEDVTAAMELLGLTVFDLMEPQNLVQLSVELTQAGEPLELLVNPQFETLMQDVSRIGADLMEQMELPMEEMDALAAEMDVLERPVELPESEFAGLLAEEAGTGREKADVDADAESRVTFTEQDVKADTAVQTKAPVEESERAVNSGLAQTENPREEEPLRETGVEPQAEEESTPADAAAGMPKQAGSEDAFSDENAGAEDDSSFDRDSRPQQTSHRPDGNMSFGVSQGAQPFEVQGTQEIPSVDTSYLSVDAMDIIEQVAEKVRVSISEEVTSMELQLNPENLGKVYLQVTAKEGAVNAQIAAANEAVKNALEMQMVQLKESLNEAGVKVDAIEVTVASHEFEQNLEQDARREEKEAERAKERAGRRSLRLDEMDEIAGMMTEEEVLAAQIMRDNGNTMDLSA